MITSMTGFASVTREEERATVSVTIRALNHRHLDIQLRMPQSLGVLEADVRTLVARSIVRGRTSKSGAQILCTLGGGQASAAA